MSKSRYIIRSERTIDSEIPEYEDIDIVDVEFNVSCYSWNIGNCNDKFDLYPKDLIKLIEELYSYKDIIDYRSFIAVLFEKDNGKLSITNEVDDKSHCLFNNYKSPEEARRKHTNGKRIELRRDRVPRYDHFIKDDHSSRTCWGNEIKYLYPQCALLFGKNNNCLKIDISEDTLKFIFNRSIRYEKYRIFPLGYFVWKADFMYSGTDNTLYGYPIEEKYIDFFSVDRPTFNTLRLGMEHLFTLDHEEWLNNNIQHIREDLGLIEKPQEKTEIKYIQYSDAVHMNNMVKELKQQIDHLRKIGVDVDYIVDSIEW